MNQHSNMETLFLPLMILAGSQTLTQDISSAGSSAQAIAQARIISAERVEFQKEETRIISERSPFNGRTYLVPIAHSNDIPTNMQNLELVEFY